MEEFFSLGIAGIDKLRKKLKSNFWSENISVIKPFMLELIGKYPEEILKCTIWGSDFFTRNQALVTPGNFPSLSKSIRAPIDILKTTDTGMNFYTYDEYIGQYGNVDKDEFISFKYMISQSLMKYNVDLNLIKIEQPSRPAFLNLINLSEKGCSKWTKIMKNRYVTENTRRMEGKWNEKLGNILGIEYWNNCYRLTKSIDFNNRLKWFHYQVVRGCLKTNSIVSKFNHNVTEQCTFCNRGRETILHLFWECDVTKTFINDTHNAMNIKTIENNRLLNRKEFLFGVSNETMHSWMNYYALHLKYYIWIARCKKEIPSSCGFTSWLLFESKLNVKYVPKIPYIINLVKKLS